MKFAPSGAAQLSGWSRERFDGRIAQRYGIAKFRERIAHRHSIAKFLY